MPKLLPSAEWMCVTDAPPDISPNADVKEVIARFADAYAAYALEQAAQLAKYNCEHDPAMPCHVSKNCRKCIAARIRALATHGKE